jgi:hypothetical protein
MLISAVTFERHRRAIGGKFDEISVTQRAERSHLMK